MNILVYGHNGWIGNMFCNLLSKKDIKYVSSKCRANDKESVVKELLEYNPSHVVSFIGRTHGKTNDGKVYTTIDYLEQPGKIYENVRDNLYSPMVLALLCMKQNIHFTYLGTGCIFKYDDIHLFGRDNTGFLENDKPNFFGSAYSIVKGFTDELMHLCEENTLNLRIRMPITDKLDPRNFITKITSYEYICSIPNSMSVLDDLLPIMLDMLTKKTTGTVNLTNPGVISHNDILTMYKNIIDPEFTWNNFSQEEQSRILDADRSNNCLNTDKLSTMYPEVKHIKQSIEDTFMRMKEHLTSLK